MQSTPVRIGTTTPIFYASVVRLRIVSITTGRTRSDYLRLTQFITLSPLNHVQVRDAFAAQSCC
jgi:hypothetical protein